MDELVVLLHQVVQVVVAHVFFVVLLVVFCKAHECECVVID